MSYFLCGTGSMTHISDLAIWSMTNISDLAIWSMTNIADLAIWSMPNIAELAIWSMTNISDLAIWSMLRGSRAHFTILKTSNENGMRSLPASEAKQNMLHIRKKKEPHSLHKSIYFIYLNFMPPDKNFSISANFCCVICFPKKWHDTTCCL